MADLCTPDDQTSKMEPPGDEHRTSKMEPVLLARLLERSTPPPFCDEDDKRGVQSRLLRRRNQASPAVRWFRNQFAE